MKDFCFNSFLFQLKQLIVLSYLVAYNFSSVKYLFFVFQGVGYFTGLIGFPAYSSIGFLLFWILMYCLCGNKVELNWIDLKKDLYSTLPKDQIAGGVPPYNFQILKQLSLPFNYHAYYNHNQRIPKHKYSYSL